MFNFVFLIFIYANLFYFFSLPRWLTLISTHFTSIHRYTNLYSVFSQHEIN